MTAEEEGIAVDERDGVLTVTIRREAVRNALDAESTAMLIEALSAHSEGALCIVLRSVGATFCAGGDLHHLQRLAAEPSIIQSSIEQGFLRLVKTIRALPVPVIAQVQGPAVGAGADIALACDIRFGSTEAWLQEAWINLGLVTPLGAPSVLVAAGGAAFALEALLTGRKIDAEECLALGLFQRVIAPDALEEEVFSLAARIARRDPEAVLAMKRLVRSVEENTFDAAYRIGLDEQVRLMSRPEFGRRVNEILAELSAK